MEEVKKLVLRLIEMNQEQIDTTYLDNFKSTLEFCNKTLELVLKQIKENE